MSHLLLVEDNALVASGIQAGLALHGLHSDWAPSARAAQAHLAARAYDACVLDLGLPDGDGMQLLRRWRAAGQTLPVLILSARSTLQDKVQGLQDGSDDYLAKPFDLPELVARLQALMRRAGGRASAHLHIAGYDIDMDSASVWQQGQRVELARREWALLQALIQARGRVLSPAQLHDHLYGLAQDVESNAINVHVHHLRKKLGPHLIETVRGQGFRLGGPP
ncbi:MAG: response regulator transcription factor [Comamonadaceae bacterium]|jgi:DNA-binding response OmpR family regulator|nr:response regulator transcription factor [Comamonadaceae bacterium]